MSSTTLQDDGAITRRKTRGMTCGHQFSIVTSSMSRMSQPSSLKQMNLELKH
jgi:hypothetical protein